MENSSHLFQSQWSPSSSESEVYSISSPDTVSPEQGFSKPPSSKATRRAPMKKTQRLSSKNPSEQRHNASEKEKLRMRDLTKALHHLRSFLPPFVAPAGQTLTKIETLRLTISYISFLSDQLGLSEEELNQKKRANCRCSYSTDVVSTSAGLAERGFHPTQNEMLYMDQESSYSQQQNISADIGGLHRSQQCAQTTQMYQASGRNFGCRLVPQALYWS